MTAEGISELRRRMPHADVDKLAADPRVQNIQELFTVGMIVKFLQAKLSPPPPERHGGRCAAMLRRPSAAFS